jgi:hypothetical protein
MDIYFILGSVVVFFLLAWRLKFLNKKVLEPTFMFLMLFGIVALIQPVSFWLYSHGFSILFPSTLGYIFAIHLK